jgi:hypothetical protein
LQQVVFFGLVRLDAALLLDFIQRQDGGHGSASALVGIGCRPAFLPLAGGGLPCPSGV